MHPPKTKVNYNFTPPFLLPLPNPLCMVVVCQPPLVGTGEHYFLMGESISMGGVLLGTLLYKLGKLRYPTASQDTTNTTTHNNQHEQVPPYKPAALVLSLHGNIRHGPISWCHRSQWV
jgi:hypothetical protein